MMRHPATVVPTTLEAGRYSFRKRGRTPPAPVSALPSDMCLRRRHVALTRIDWIARSQKVLSKFATSNGLKLTLTVEVAPPGGVSAQKVDETKAALRELKSQRSTRHLVVLG